MVKSLFKRRRHLVLLSLVAFAFAVCGDFALAVGIEGPDSSTRKASTINTTGNAAWVYEKSGYVDTANGAARIEICQCDYETVAASQTDQVMGGAGAVGDYLHELLIVPATTSPGAVSIKDGAGSAITVFTGGASSVTTLAPIPVPIDISSIAGPWKVTTGAAVSVLASGRFAP